MKLTFPLELENFGTNCAFFVEADKISFRQYLRKFYFKLIFSSWNYQNFIWDSDFFIGIDKISIETTIFSLKFKKIKLEALRVACWNKKNSFEYTLYTILKSNRETFIWNWDFLFDIGNITYLIRIFPFEILKIYISNHLFFIAQ